MKMLLLEAQSAADGLEFPDRKRRIARDVALDRLIRGPVIVLGKVTEAKPPGLDHLAGVECFVADENLEKGCLPGPIGPDDSRVLAFVDGKCRAIKK